MLEAGWWLFKFLVTGLCLPAVLFIFYTSSNRALIEKHPRSLIYKATKFLDSLFVDLLKISTPAGHKQAANPPRPVSSLHYALGISEAISFRQSFSASVDLSQHLSKKWLDRIGSFGFETASILGGCVLSCLLSLAVATTFFHFPDGIAFLVFLGLSLFISFLICFIVLWPDGVVQSLQRLRFNKTLSLTVDNKLANSHSGWGNLIVKNDGEVLLFAKSDGLIHGLYWGSRASSNLEPRWILRLPSFVSEEAFKVGELEELAGKLNELMAMARKVPEIKYVEIGTHRPY